MGQGGTAAEPPVLALARSAMAAAMEALALGDRAVALRWLERAHRLVPADPNTTLVLASTCLDGDPARAAGLFEAVAAEYDVRQAWAGLAAARLRLGGTAAAALAHVLSRHAFAPDLLPLAHMVAGTLGWCGLSGDGRLEVHAVKPRVLFDGKILRGRRLPVGWERGGVVEVLSGGQAVLGSPIQIPAIRRLSGCVEAVDGGLSGWAWHPADPDHAPVVVVTFPSGETARLQLDDEAIAVADAGPLARPRRFHISAGDLAGVVPRGLIHVRGLDGKDLTGSPLDPFAEEESYRRAAMRLARLYPAGDAGPGLQDTAYPVAVVIPVHNGRDVTLACLTSVLDRVSADIRLVVVDDGSQDPGLIAVLDGLAHQGRIVLLRHEVALGFPAAANAGVRACAGHDVVLLNSDTLVPEGWLGRLRQAAYSSGDIGTVTPLSNDASIVSYPGPAGTNPRPDQAGTDRLDGLAARANGSEVVDIPVGVGFCLYLRRDCLNAVGLFRANVFAQGYGEENDFCLRARRLGWRNVALTGLFVGHAGGASFGAAAKHLRDRNGRMIERLHPGHDSLIADFVSADPLAKSRRRIDVVGWRERLRQPVALLIGHCDGGGVERRLVLSVAAHEKAGWQPVVLRPVRTACGEIAIAVRDGAGVEPANLVYAMPGELPALLGMLGELPIQHVEVHHLADYPAAIYDLVTSLGAEYDVHVHDYAWFCPRISLVGAQNRYCGEPDLPDCEICIADHGSFLHETVSVAYLRQRSAAFLAGARRVVVPSQDTGRRMRRYFEGLRTIVEPHEDDVLAIRGGAAVKKSSGRASVCLVGAIGVHKGYDILLACARDAARRHLDLEFVVVGHTIGDARLIDTGRVFVTGQYNPDEAVALIRQQQSMLGFVASIWPETWCLSLGDIWRAGLTVAAFDIGAPAERIRSTGQGFLLPLGLSPGAINNALMTAVQAAKQ